MDVVQHHGCSASLFLRPRTAARHGCESQRRTAQVMGMGGRSCLSCVDKRWQKPAAALLVTRCRPLLHRLSGCQGGQGGSGWDGDGGSGGGVPARNAPVHSSSPSFVRSTAARPLRPAMTATQRSETTASPRDGRRVRERGQRRRRCVWGTACTPVSGPERVSEPRSLRNAQRPAIARARGTTRGPNGRFTGALLHHFDAHTVCSPHNTSARTPNTFVFRGGGGFGILMMFWPVLFDVASSFDRGWSGVWW